LKFHWVYNKSSSSNDSCNKPEHKYEYYHISL
jgi:hypothetical protein